MRSPIRIRLLIALALLGTVFSARLWMISSWASDVPFYDQWQAEGMQALVPWKLGTLSPNDILASHNEHRVALTRLTAIALTALGGVWDPRVQMVFNAFLFSATVTIVWWWLQERFTGAGRSIFVALALTAVAAVPLSWQNTINGFHSQQFYLIALSLFGINLTLRRPELTRGWWLGMVCLGMDLFSMGSGFAAAAAVIVAILVFEKPMRGVFRSHGVTLAACAIIVVVGLFLRVDFPPHRPLKASTLPEFLHALLKLMEWPQKGFPPFMILSYLPLALLAWNRWRARTRDSLHSWDCVVICVGIWSAAQLVATAYSRGAGAPEPATRYLDSLNAGVFVNFIAGLALLSRCQTSGRPRSRLRLMVITWCLCVGTGFARQTDTLFRSTAEPIRAWFQDMTLNLARYVSTKDELWLHDRSIPFPDEALLIEFVRNPVLRNLLPVSVRDAIPVTAEIHDGFDEQRVSDHSPAFSHGTFWTSHANMRGRWVSGTLQPPGMRYLRFEVAGKSVSADGDRLELWSDDLRTRLRSIVLPTLDPARPADVYVRVPDRPFRIVATHAGVGEGWFAFTQPASMPALSHFCLRLADCGRFLLQIFLALLAIAFAARLSTVKPPVRICRCGPQTGGAGS